MSTFRSAHSEIQDKISVGVYIVTETVLGHFARIKNLIWDQLQATKAEIIQS